MGRRTCTEPRLTTTTIITTTTTTTITITITITITTTTITTMQQTPALAVPSIRVMPPRLVQWLSPAFVGGMMRAYDGMTGTTLRVFDLRADGSLLRATVYQVRASGIAGNTEDRNSNRHSGNLIFELQCAGMDTNWPMIPALSHTYQLR